MFHLLNNDTASILGITQNFIKAINTNSKLEFILIQSKMFSNRLNIANWPLSSNEVAMFSVWIYVP